MISGAIVILTGDLLQGSSRRLTFVRKRLSAFVGRDMRRFMRRRDVLLPEFRCSWGLGR